MQKLPSEASLSTNLWRTAQLEDCGVSGRQLARLVKAERFVRLQKAGYVSGDYWKGLSPDQRALLRILLHDRVSSGAYPPVYSHTSAARLFGLHLWNVDARIHLTQSFRSSSTEHAPDVVRHCAPLPSGDVSLAGGLRATSLARTVVDCARTLTYRQGLIAADHSLRMGLSRTDLQQVVDRLRGYRGVGTARRVVADASVLSESPGETLMRRLVHELPVTAPEEQVLVHTAQGEHRLDAAWKNRKLALEFDGKTKYFDYAPTGDVLYQERRRERALMEQGWTFVRLEWKDLFRERETGDRILRAWHAAGRRMAA
jgi:hypothetical protein